MSVMMDFYSDNTGAAAAELVAAIAEINHGTVAAYGADDCTALLLNQLRKLFENEHLVFALVSSGTAANGLSLALAAAPFTGIFCHETAHVYLAEAGAAEFFTGGARLFPIAGENSKIDASRLESGLALHGENSPNRLRPSVLSLTQATDYGAVYELDEIRRLCAIARGRGMKVHMDGARFANALVAKGCSPAEMTWRAGIDLLSFGVTKNGGLTTEVVLIFDPDLARDLSRVLRRTGQLSSKMRYPASQVLAYLKDDLWLRLAQNANAAAMDLARRLRPLAGVETVAPVETNLVMLRLREELVDRLAASGLRMVRKPDGTCRLVCRADTTPAEIGALVEFFAAPQARAVRA